MFADSARRAALAAVVLAAAAAAAAAAAEGPPALDVTAPKGAVSVGDRVFVRVAARGGEELMWGELRVAAEPGGTWEIVDGPREIEGARPPVWELVLAPMAVGEVELPAVSAVVRPPGGEPREIAAVGPPVVSVASVLPADEDIEPAPLRDPLGVSGFPWEWVLPLAVPALGLAAVLAGWRRRRRHALGFLEAPPLAPLDELEALLEQLEERVGREPAEGVCDRLAGGLRHFLERRSGRPAEEMTSFELRLLARRLEWPETVRRGVQVVMGVADGIRFGRLPIAESELLGAIETARRTAGGLEEFLTAEEEREIEEAAG